MTVSYTAKVANSNHFGCFLKLLLRWKGSIYKLVWPDLFLFLSLFFSLSLVYRFFLDEGQQRTFEKVAVYCEKYGTLIPVSFVLGFYVSIVIRRWWEQFRCIPWIDTLAIWVNSNIRGDEEKDRILRRTLMRYTCLSITQAFTLISPRVKKRFPTLDHLVEAGLLMESEKEILLEIEQTAEAGAQYSTYFVPLVWSASIVTRARAENKIKNDSVVKSLLDEINKIKDNLFLLLSYDWISVPLVYTQVVTLAVYMYFFSCLMGKQWVKHPGKQENPEYGKIGVEGLDLFFPVFTILQFFFYMGWLKVAESLLNPFGDDDDDFELNWIVDRNIQVAYLIVDGMHRQHPELLKDQYWDEVIPTELPHTVASEQYKEEPPVNSTAGVIISRQESEIHPLSSLRSNLHLASSVTGIQDGGVGNTTPGSKRASVRRGRFSSQRSNSNQSQAGAAGPISGSMSGSVTRMNRIGSAFKRMISRDRDRRGSGSGGADGEVFGSLINMPSQLAIPELDENMVTIVSTKRDDQGPKPTVQEIFGLRDPVHQPPPTSYDAMTVEIPKEGEEEEFDPLSDVTTICITPEDKFPYIDDKTA